MPADGQSTGTAPGYSGAAPRSLSDADTEPPLSLTCHPVLVRALSGSLCRRVPTAPTCWRGCLPLLMGRGATLPSIVRPHSLPAASPAPRPRYDVRRKSQRGAGLRHRKGAEPGWDPVRVLTLPSTESPAVPACSSPGGGREGGSHSHAAPVRICPHSRQPPAARPYSTPLPSAPSPPVGPHHGFQLSPSPTLLGTAPFPQQRPARSSPVPVEETPASPRPSACSAAPRPAQPRTRSLRQRNAGRECDRPGRRPTSGADKAAFLLPPQPAKHAACSRRGKRQRQQMPKGRAQLPSNSKQSPCPLRAGLPSGWRLPAPRQKSLSSPCRSGASPGRTPSPAAPPARPHPAGCGVTPLPQLLTGEIGPRLHGGGHSRAEPCPHENGAGGSQGPAAEECQPSGVRRPRAEQRSAAGWDTAGDSAFSPCTAVRTSRVPVFFLRCLRALLVGTGTGQLCPKLGKTGAAPLAAGPGARRSSRTLG